MEKLDRPKNGGWFGEGEIVDADLLVDLLKAYRFGKGNIPARKTRSTVAPVTAPAPENTTGMENDEEDHGSQGNKSIRESTSSDSDPILLESTLSETGSNNESGSSNETGLNNEEITISETGSSESSSTNLPNVVNESQQKAEDGEEEEHEEEEDSERSSTELEEKANLEMFLATQEEEEENERSVTELEKKVNLEKLLATQENYELFCPSCSSCITRRVILKKRKCGNDIDLSDDVKLVDESSDIEEIEPPVKVHVPEVGMEDDDQVDKQEGYIFTCLACLKYYIRLGARFLQFDYVKGKPVEEPEVHLEAKKSSNTTESPPQSKPDPDRFTIELLKSTVYGGLTETITSLGVVSSASASGSSTENILALAVANLAGGLILLAQNLQDLRNNSDQDKDRYEGLLGRRTNFRLHVLVAVLSYIFFGLIPPLVYAFSFYETGIKNYKLASVFSVSLVCVILLSMIKVYVRKPGSESLKSYLKSAAYYTSIVVASSGISYVVGDYAGEYIGKLGWFNLDQLGITSPFDGIKPEDFRFTSY